MSVAIYLLHIIEVVWCVLVVSHTRNKDSKLKDAVQETLNQTIETVG